MSERLFCTRKSAAGTPRRLRRLASGAKGRRRSSRVLLHAVLGLVVPIGAALVGAGGVSAATATPAHPVLAPESGSYVFTLTFDGVHRDYRLHVPPAAASGKPLPLVLNLHGATQNAQLEEITSDMDPNADTNGYLVAYPNGTRISKVLTPDPVAKNAQYGWNAGMCCGLPVTEHINDVGFLLKVISDIAAKTPVDLRRVYMTGISNGGMMAYAMAAEASGHVAAISSVSGQVEIPVIHPTRAVPTMEFHSVDDPIAKFDGTPNANPLDRLSVMQGIDQWVKADGCDKKPTRAPPSWAPPDRFPLGKPRRRSPTRTAGRAPKSPSGVSPVLDTCGPGAR